MAENEISVENETAVQPEQLNAPPEEQKKPGFGAKIKEGFRKFCVNLKRKPQRIPFYYLLVVTVFNLLTLYTYSQAIVIGSVGVDWVGLLEFVNTLFSVLVVVAFLNTFPKLKKKGSKTVFTMKERGIDLHINIFMLIVTVLMAVAMIVCEAIYYNIEVAHYASFTEEELATIGVSVKQSIVLSMTHIILLAVFLLLLFTLPLYRKLIMMINTSVKLESATENMQEIDLQD